MRKTTNNSLELISNASKMLAESNTIQKAKELKDLALTVADWAKRKGMGEKAVRYALNYAFEAEKRMGELLKGTERAKGGRPYEKSTGTQKEPVKDTTTLSELGITKKESSSAQFLADLTEDEFEKVKSGKKKVSVLKREKKRKEDEKAIKEKTFPIIKGKFKTILVDPSWDYKQLSLAGRGHPEYAPMKLEKLKELDIRQYAENNCHLYIWSTNNFLYEALNLGKEWGFSYKTLITWIKPSIGLGSYFRNSTEQLLFFVKGKLSTRTTYTPTHFEAPRGNHSEKPEISYQLIELNSYPNYLEYFSRKKRTNWTTWGMNK